MEIKSNLCSNAVRKVALLITAASSLGMDVSSYGQADEKQNSGNVYLWLEDYPFTLFIDLSGDDEIQACWSDPEDGNECFVTVGNMTLAGLYDWVSLCESHEVTE